MTLPDGTLIEFSLPSPHDTDRHAVHGYRVRGAEGVTEFSTLTALADHILQAVTPRPEEPVGDAGGRVRTGDEGHLPITDSVHE